MPTDLALAGAIRKLREERGLSQEDVAFAAGVTTAALSKLERGATSPNWSTIRSIAAALDVRPSELVVRSGQ
jgi:transcriptional regulator with XRE-family HTH domain